MANPNEYIVYAPDQVLTNDHLNETFNYLDQQNRWTRNKLLGIGIVCGFNITQKTGIIEVSKGCGVTSQGYLILQDTKQYAYYIPYPAPDQPADLPFTYPGNLPFYKPFCDKKNIWLLLTDDDYNALETDQQKNALTLSSAPARFLNEYVVVLFLEAKELDLKNCSTFDCNNKGEKMMFQVRALLVAKKDLPVAAPATSTGTTTVTNYPYELTLKRFNVPYANLQTADDIINAFASLVDDTTLSRVANAYVYAYEKYKPVLNEPTDPFTGLLAQLVSQRNSILAGNKVFIQYFYDFVDDLIKAFYEFCVKISGIISACCPDENLFPLHLVLGEASQNTNTFAKDAYRTYFIYSPLFNKTYGQASEVQFLFQRMKLLVKDFVIPSPKTFSDALIKITPSQYEHPSLSKRAIPYYYSINETGDPLYQWWNFYKTMNGNAAFNLSYNANLYNTNDTVVNPLLYDLEYYNFFRVEGHIGKNYNTVLNNLVSQVKNYNLPFDVVAVQAGGDANDVPTNLPQCSFQDLDSMFNVLRSELYCLLGKLICYAGKQTYNPPLVIIPIPVNLGAVTGSAGTTPTSGASGTESSSTLASSVFSSSLLNISLINLLVYIKGTFLKQQTCFESFADGTVGKYYAAHVPSGTYMLSTFDPANLSNNFLSVVDLIEEVISTLYYATPSSLDVDSFTQKMSLLQNYLSQLGDVFWQFEVDRKQENALTDFEKTMDLFGEVINSCKAKEFSALKNEYNARASKIKQQLLFTNYYTSHKGLEHKAGVPKGGTLVIVYNPPGSKTTGANTSKAATNVAASSAAPKTSKASKASKAAAAATPAAAPSLQDITLRLQSTFSDIIARDPDFVNRAMAALTPGLAAILLPPTYSDYEVIADFYLPYKCCSDCAPVAYILPEPTTPQKPTVKMNTSFCDNDTNASKIAVSQAGGTFADANGNKVKGLDEAALTFTPSVAGAGTYTIIYTLNGLAADPVTVTVLKTPASSDFKFRSVKSSQNLAFNVTFMPAVQDAAFTYTWTFGPGFSVQQSKDQQPAITATVPASGGELKSFATLTVSNGACGAVLVRKDLLISPNGVSEITNG